jgi:hypothetical protein
LSRVDCRAASKVGSHRRIAFDDLIAYARRMREQQAGALERMADNARELGLEYWWLVIGECWFNWQHFQGVVNLSNMKAKLLLRERRVLEIGFIEVVVWGLSQPMDGSLHRFKYRLAYVVRGECVLRYDNESGKGDHRHSGRTEKPYAFVSVDQLLDDFLRDVARWKGK